MTPTLFLSSVLVPGLKFLTATCGPKPGLAINWEDDAEARVLLLAIAGQESNWADVRQANDGAGAGPWQMQENTVSDILGNDASVVMAHKVCAKLTVIPRASYIWPLLIPLPDLAVSYARLDLYCDPRPLSVYGDSRAAWLYYKRDWDPGLPHPAVWDGIYDQALAADKAYAAAQGAKA